MGMSPSGDLNLGSSCYEKLVLLLDLTPIGKTSLFLNVMFGSNIYD